MVAKVAKDFRIMNEKQKLKTLGRPVLYFYQRMFWYIQNAKNELLKPLGFYNETLLILTFLSVRFDFNPGVQSIILAYLAALALLSVIGKIVVKVGVVDYNNTINNRQNPELMAILKSINEIKAEIKEIKNNGRSNHTQ